MRRKFMSLLCYLKEIYWEDLHLYEEVDSNEKLSNRRLLSQSQFSLIKNCDIHVFAYACIFTNETTSNQGLIGCYLFWIILRVILNFFLIKKNSLKYIQQWSF